MMTLRVAGASAPARPKNPQPPPMSFTHPTGSTDEGIGGEEKNMLSLAGKSLADKTLADKTMVVIGGSRGVGRRIVEAGIGHGARVLAVARAEAALRQLAREVRG